MGWIQDPGSGKNLFIPSLFVPNPDKGEKGTPLIRIRSVGHFFLLLAGRISFFLTKRWNFLRLFEQRPKKTSKSGLREYKMLSHKTSLLPGRA
jgi:hypothetical protein